MFVKTSLSLQEFACKLEVAIQGKLRGKINSYYLNNSEISTHNSTIPKGSKFFYYLKYAEENKLLNLVQKHIEPLAWYCNIQISKLDGKSIGFTAGSGALSLIEPTFLFISLASFIASDFKKSYTYTVKVYNLSEIKRLLTGLDNTVEPFETFEIWVYYSDNKANQFEEYNIIWRCIEEIANEFSYDKKVFSDVKNLIKLGKDFE
ncbi:hypothetical protein [Aquifex sp.]